MQRTEANNYYPHLMAKKLAVDGATAADTDLDWIEGANLETHTPIFAIVTYDSGTLGIADISIYADIVNLTGSIPLATLTATETKFLINLTKQQIAITNDPAAFMVVDVTTASAVASAFNVYVYGIELN